MYRRMRPSAIRGVERPTKDDSTARASEPLALLTAKLTDLAAKGARRAVFGLPQGPRDEVLAVLDAMAPLVETMRPVN